MRAPEDELGEAAMTDGNETGVVWLRRVQRWLLPVAVAATIGFVAVTLVGAQSPDAEEQSGAEATVMESQSEHKGRGYAGGRVDGFGHKGKRDRSGRVAELAELVGTDSETLRAALKDGQTLAEVAEANGVDAETVIDALAERANERIDAALEAEKLSEGEAASKRSEVVEQVTEFVNQTHAFKDKAAGKRGRGERLSGLAELVGTDAQSLREALKDGRTLAEVAVSNGVEVEAVIEALVAMANERIDEAVAAGKLTDAEAEEKRAELETRIASFVNEGKDGDWRGGREGRGHLRR